MLSEEQAKQALNEKVNELISNNWNWIKDDYVVYTPERYHRTKTREILNISNIKNKLFSSLGYIPVFFFLQKYGSLTKNPGPYRTAEKGKLSFL